MVQITDEKGTALVTAAATAYKDKMSVDLNKSKAASGLTFRLFGKGKEKEATSLNKAKALDTKRNKPFK